jgi:hypothetical protein
MKKEVPGTGVEEGEDLAPSSPPCLGSTKTMALPQERWWWFGVVNFLDEGKGREMSLSKIEVEDRGNPS